MVLEIARLKIRDDAVDAFAAGIQTGKDVIGSQPGCGSVRLLRCAEDPQQFLLFVEWEDIDRHMNFRQSEDFMRYRSTVQHTFAEEPSYLHYIALADLLLEAITRSAATGSLRWKASAAKGEQDLSESEHGLAVLSAEDVSKLLGFAACG